jgi:tRNA C32,U32 (ribose-2'-O)-methylase TrmJ
VALEFLDPGNPRQLMRRLRRLYNRARPDENEVNILRGILAAARQTMKPGP